MGERPNIIMILTDDQGYWSLGCYGNREVISPNIDALAQRGCLFQNFFCTSPVCSPARASIMTGLLPSQHGVIDWLGGGSMPISMYDDLQVNLKRSATNLQEKIEDLDSYPDDATISFKKTLSYRYMIHEKEPIEYLKDYVGYTDILAQNGYVCGLSGKWHLGDSLHPQKSFSFWRTIARGGTQYSCPEYVRDGQLSIPDRYITDLIGDDAVEFIEKNAGNDRPFYLSVHFTAPHDPWEKDDQPAEIWNLYNGKPFDSVPVTTELHPNQLRNQRVPADEADRKYIVQGYYTTITAMDRQVGRIVDTLQARGILDNTIILFTADNGFNMGHHHIWGKGNGTVPFNMYDTSVKVPMIIAGPGIEPNAVKSALVSQYDIFPTILDMAKVAQYTGNDKAPGQSFLPLLAGKTDSFREDVVVYDEYGPVRMIRTETYKYVHCLPGGPDQLFDLVHDPEELENLADRPEYRPIKLKLYRKLTQWFEAHVYPEHDAARCPIPTAMQPGRTMYTGQFDRVEALQSEEDVMVFAGF